MSTHLRCNRKSGITVPKNFRDASASDLSTLVLDAIDQDGSHIHFPGNGEVFINGNELPDFLKQFFYKELTWRLQHLFMFHDGTKSKQELNK